MAPIPFAELECPRCGAEGTLRPPENDLGVYEEGAVECTNCGRQHVGRREPLSELFK